jgi:hypothetical protein
LRVIEERIAAIVWAVEPLVVHQIFRDELLPNSDDTC